MMSSNYNTPINLAESVHKKLKELKISDAAPSLSVLQEILNCAYYTSMKTEEGQHISVTLTYINPNHVKTRTTDRFDKWRLHLFNKPIELNIPNLVKLSKAADPWSSNLALYDDGEKILIYGMIDQSIHYQSYLHHENEDKPRSPGLFQLFVTGIGNLSVMIDFEPIATLNKHTISRKPIDVLQFGEISQYLRENCKLEKAELEEILQEKIDNRDVEALNEDYLKYVKQSLTRILLRIKNYNHGGALLITKDFVNGLKKKYEICYGRIRSANLHLLSLYDYMELLEQDIDKLKKSGGDISYALFDDYRQNEMDINDAENELTGAVRFVSSLSCVDGLVLLSPDLEVNGFGTIIKKVESKIDEIFISKTARIGRNFKKVTFSHFGTRHQSMFSYCSQNEESVGFVISQDGEIRTIKNVGGRIYIWEDIKVHRYLKSAKLARPIIRRKIN